MKIVVTFILLVSYSVQSIYAQDITSVELSKLSADINALQIAAEGKTFIDPEKNISAVITFPRESFNVFFSSGLAFQAVYKDNGTDQLFVTENIDFSKANKVTAMPVNSKSSAQCIRVLFTETVETRVMQNGKEVNKISGNTLDFYYPTGNTDSKNKLISSLETLISKLIAAKTKYQTPGHGKLTLQDGFYEGDYVAGNRRSGEGTMEYKNEPLHKGVWIYKGAWKNDRRNGEGVLKSIHNKKGDIIGADGGKPEEIYTGVWVDDLLQGKGKYEKWSWKYEGNFVNGKMEGHGTSIDSYGSKYVGEWKNGVKEGIGTQGGYTGEWKNGYEEGKGKYVASSFTKEGDWKNGRLHGYAIYKDNNGESYDGYWIENKKEGKGTFTYANGEKYVGEWKKDLQDGYGIYTWPNGDKYDGGWLNNSKSGKGTFTYKNGDKFVGEWTMTGNVRSGILYNKNNIIIQQGKWYREVYDNPVKPARLYAKDIIEKYTVINSDTSQLICYSLTKDSISFYFYKPAGSSYQPTIYFDVNNNNEVDTLVDKFYRNFRDKLQNFYIKGGSIPAKRVWSYKDNLLVITYPITEVSQSNVIAFQVAYKNWGELTDKAILLPSRKDELDFKKKRLFYITIPK